MDWDVIFRMSRSFHLACIGREMGKFMAEQYAMVLLSQCLIFQTFLFLRFFSFDVDTMELVKIGNSDCI